MPRKRTKPVDPVDKFISDTQKVIYDNFHDYFLWFAIQAVVDAFAVAYVNRLEGIILVFLINGGFTVYSLYGFYQQIKNAVDSRKSITRLVLAVLAFVISIWLTLTIH